MNVYAIENGYLLASQAVSFPGPGGGSGGSAEPPLQINDIRDYCYALEKLRAEMYVLHNTPTFLCSFNTYLLELASYSFVVYNIKTP